jgi:hypothetical protein
MRPDVCCIHHHHHHYSIAQSRKTSLAVKAVSDMALDPLRFARQDMVGELNLGCHRRVFTNQLQFSLFHDKVVDRRPQQGEGSKSLARAGISIPLFRFIFGQ